MGGTTLRPEDQSTKKTDQPVKQETDQPTTKKKMRNWATWAAWAAAVVAALAAGPSIWQLVISTKENTATQQDKLVTLTATIAEQMAEEQTASNQATGTLTDPTRSAAATNKMTELIAKLTVEGQAGAVLINNLDGNGVAGIEYIEVAQALEVGGDIPTAITYYNHALKTPPRDAPTRATARRYLGILYYSLDQPGPGHYHLIQAAKLFRGHPMVSQYYKANIIAQAYLVDAYWQLRIKGCATAQEDMTAAQVAQKSYPKTPLVQSYTDADNEAYKSKCSSV